MRENKYTTKEEIDLIREEIKAAKLNDKNTKFTSARVVRFSIFLVLFILLSSVFISVRLSKYLGETPQIFGYQLYRVQSGSMSPTLKVGTIILSKKPIDTSTLKVGDIVTFHRNRVIITHRIIEVVKNNGVKYRTKGDNTNNSPDTDLLSPEDVKAVFVLKLY